MWSQLAISKTSLVGNPYYWIASYTGGTYIECHVIEIRSEISERRMGLHL
jgi:hypothetical protein